MAEPPSGDVTFLFTDIEGSTARWDAHPDAMRAALPVHDHLLRTAVERHGGHVFKTVGDAFCAAFARADDALAAAVAAQQAVAQEDWARFGKDFPPLAVRMGLHTGEATERGGDYFGPPVNRVARIEAAGHGGQILLSGATRAVVAADGLPDGVRLRDRGEHRLKDLRHTEHIFQVIVAGLADVVKDLRTAGKLAAHERIVVADPNAPLDTAAAAGLGVTTVTRTVEETMAALEAVVRGDEETVVLTAEQVVAVARRRPADWREWRLGRIAEWSQPRYRLDGRFVALTLLVDQGEQSITGRWQAQEERFDDLGDLLAAVPDPVIVVLGPPGGGKSTLLRRLELDAAIDGLRGEGDAERDADSDAERVTFFVSLNLFPATRPGEPPPAPAEWLSAVWGARHPDLPPLHELVAVGRVTFLLDGLNELPAASERDFRARVQDWKGWLQRVATGLPGNRIILSCRSLDYSQPLSTPELRVPQVRIEPLSDDQVRAFLTVYSPGRWREVWAALAGRPHLEVLRSPYFLALLVAQVESTGEMPAGRAALFTGFVRQALRREVERGNALFEPGAVLAAPDVRRLTAWRWRGPHDLPSRGVLVDRLAHLAHVMQRRREDGGASQVRIPYVDALDALDSDIDAAILAAGTALAVLDEDQAADEVMFIHQLVQEYFAARALAAAPDAALVRAPWRTDEVRPSTADVIAALDPADALPPLPGTGWEETTILAAAMAGDPTAFLAGVRDVNLALAGRAAAQPDVLPHLAPAAVDALRAALVARSQDAAADLRDRIACGLAAGRLDDPRFARRDGRHGAYRWPPLVDVPAGDYPIGADDPITWSVPGFDGASVAHVPRHVQAVAAFRIGRFPVTNAEYAAFIAAGGYDDERWWTTPDAQRWRRGALPNEGALLNNRLWRQRFLRDPALLEQIVDQGRFSTSEAAERWRLWVTLPDAAFEAAMRERWQPQRETEPRFWRDPQYNEPAQPVNGVSWYEALAYCAWLAATSGAPVRLPTEVEWEAAAGGADGRPFPWGDGVDVLRANTLATRVKATSPVGVFVAGDTPDGIADLAGNVYEWTTSLFGPTMDDEFAAAHGYPYDAADGREDLAAPPDVRRVLRGGGWGEEPTLARTAFRFNDLPDVRPGGYGFRIVVAPPFGAAGSGG